MQKDKLFKGRFLREIMILQVTPCHQNLISSFQTHLKNSLGRREMLIKIIFNIDAIPEVTRTKLCLILLPFYIRFGMRIKKYVSGILQRRLSIVLRVSNRINLLLESCFKTKLKYSFFLLEKALRGQLQHLLFLLFKYQMKRESSS